MAPQLFHLEGPSLEELKTRAAALYGPRALIVSAELVTVGGIRGVLARKHYEIVVEVPEHDGEPAPATRPRGRRSTEPNPSGLDALLLQAELDEVRLAGGSGVVPPAMRRSGAGDAAPAGVSTDSGLFAALMDNLTFATEPAEPVGEGSSRPGAATRSADPASVPASVPAAVPAASAPITQEPASVSAASVPIAQEPAAGPPSVIPHLAPDPADPAELPVLAGLVLESAEASPPVPAVLRAPGDLVVVVGAPAAAWEVVLSMAAAFAGGLPAAAAIAGPPGWLSTDARRVDDRLDANTARAAGVDGGHAVFLALASEDAVTDGSLLLALRPDQVWVAVDAGRKEADAAAWVGGLARSMERAGLEPAGLAVVGSSTTATPETVLALGLPVGWQDGRPAGAVAPRRRRNAPRGRRRAEQPGIG
ncbi:hypothetical protein [Arthrobacter sp. NPDC092385]|uniref:hypothetical protein n=1 Tax=Arthrobacter sp. NPDC092385 TaxID=3363943 RepID=UPI0037F8CB23